MSNCHHRLKWDFIESIIHIVRILELFCMMEIKKMLILLQNIFSSHFPLFHTSTYSRLYLSNNYGLHLALESWGFTHHDFSLKSLYYSQTAWNCTDVFTSTFLPLAVSRLTPEHLSGSAGACDFDLHGSPAVPCLSLPQLRK